MRDKILLVDRDIETTNRLEANLRADGFQVIAAGNGASALAQAKDRLPALIVLDAALPDISGFEVCRQLQANATTRRIQIIFLSADASEQDRILGFELGADDYIAKPSSAREIVLRIKKSLDRTTVAPAPPLQPKLTLGPLVLDSFRHEVSLEEEILHLTPIEYRILELLIKHLGGALDRKTIHQGVWPGVLHPNNRTIDAHIKRLRKKLGTMGRAIETLTGFGYRMNESAALSTPVVDPRQMKLNELVFAINRMNGSHDDVPGLKKKLNAILALK